MYEALSYLSMRCQATSVCGIELVVYEALRRKDRSRKNKALTGLRQAQAEPRGRLARKPRHPFERQASWSLQILRPTRQCLFKDTFERRALNEAGGDLQSMPVA